MTQVISGFPGIGKTVLHQLRVSILDSDSSTFSWVSEGVRHPDFPNNYMEHIKNNIGKVDYILVSSHDVVRNALHEHGIDYTLVYPSIELRDEYLIRYETRGSSEGFINFIGINWDSFITAIEAETFPKLVKLESGKYLSDVIKSRRAVMCSGCCNSDADDYCGMYMVGEECPACAALRTKEVDV